MPESALTLLKFVFLALVYLFLFFVVRTVVRELRAPAPAPVGVPVGAAGPAPRPPAPPRSAAVLRVVAPDARRGEEVEVTDREITVGRGGGCDLVLTDDPFASTTHARIFRRGDELLVEDLESSNGTFVNERRIARTTRLVRGDRIRFGGTVCDVVR